MSVFSKFGELFGRGEIPDLSHGVLEDRIVAVPSRLLRQLEQAEARFRYLSRSALWMQIPELREASTAGYGTLADAIDELRRQHPDSYPLDWMDRRSAPDVTRYPVVRADSIEIRASGPRHHDVEVRVNGERVEEWSRVTFRAAVRDFNSLALESHIAPMGRRTQPEGECGESDSPS